jgi:hypothetical protein
MCPDPDRQPSCKIFGIVFGEGNLVNDGACPVGADLLGRLAVVPGELDQTLAREFLQCER